MTYKICYWDSTSNSQKEREATAEEVLEIEERKLPKTITESERWETIKQIRDTKVQTGGYRAANKWFHSDTFSRTQQMGLVMLGANLPAGMQWKTMDSTFITMTPSLAATVFQAAAMQDSLLFKHAEILKADSSLDINQGWPVTYGG